jgi:immune inhibitor A
LRVKKLAVALTAVTLAVGIAAPASAASPKVQKPTADRGHMSDNLPGAQAKEQAALKIKARDMVAKGKATPKGKNQVVQVGKGQFVELAFEGDDQILTLLGQFGTTPATHNHGDPAAGGFGIVNHGGTAGPLHNQIPQPNRAVDNTTIWTADFNQSHYDNLLYNKAQKPSMANWYLEQSSGRFSVDGYVSDWVQVPFNEAAYGSNYCGSIVCTRDIGRFLVDQTTAWYNAQLASGKTAAQIDEMLAPFDVWDRNDYDEDGDFDEPDGYIDHFQSVHAGEGEETGGGAQGTNAIWSHRSFANAGFPTSAGPTVDGNLDAQGGLPLGGSKFWIGDYTIEPENGGVGVFAHEFGHDLGLPDEYDTSGNTGGAENGTAWWTPWSQGSYGTVNGVDLGSSPVGATVWEKWMLGWANVGVAHAGKSSSHRLSASVLSTKQRQGLQVVLPDKVLSEQIGAPHSGSWLYDSNHGNDLDNTMTKTVTLGAGPISASFWANYDIETCWDYAYLQVSTDGGANFVNVHTSASSAENTNGQNFGEGITGRSGAPFVCDAVGGARTWTQVTADLSAYANSTIQLRFRYWTDGAAVGQGFQVDDLEITGQAADGAETDLGWTFDGFRRTQAVLVTSYPNYYFAEFRTYKGYDAALKLGPYNFTNPAGKLVTHFPYQDGLLIWYYDTSQHDNNVGDHPGQGLILPIDAHPNITHWSNGTVARPRLQSYDATFGLEKTDAISIPSTTLGNLTVAAQAAVRTFNDNVSYYRASDPADAASFYKARWNSVNHPHTNTVIKVASVTQGSFMQVIVNP